MTTSIATTERYVSRFLVEKSFFTDSLAYEIAYWRKDHDSYTIDLFVQKVGTHGPLLAWGPTRTTLFYDGSIRRYRLRFTTPYEVPESLHTS